MPQLTSHKITSHKIASHKITSHKVASHKVASHKKAVCDYKAATRRAVVKVTNLPASFDIQKMRYVEPKNSDLAIGLVYFNAVKSKRLLMNYLYIKERLKIAKIPVFTIEMYEDVPEISDAIHVKTDFILFQKERLCHLLEKYIPESYPKLMFMDCDLIFGNPNWYNEVSEKLSHFDVVQPFSRAIWLDLTYKKRMKERLPIAFYNKLGTIPNSGGIGGYHPGFAWGFNRAWFRANGFFQYAILGDGDTISSTIWFNYPHFEYKQFLLDAVNTYRASIAMPNTCFVDGTVYHLWHGDSKKRQYSSRRKIFKDVYDIRAILKVDTNGLFSLKDDALKPQIRAYFTKRDDDGLF